MNGRLFVFVAATAWFVVLAGIQDSCGATEKRAVTIVVAQDGTGDFRGEDEKPILAAIEKAGEAGATILIGPGEYLIRRKICPSSNITIKGTEKTVLRLPAPVLVSKAAPEGQTFLVVEDTSEFAAETAVELLPPDGVKTFPEASEEKFVLGIKRIEPGRLFLSEPLPVSVPKGSRVGYKHNLFELRGSEKNVRFKSLTIDGGRKPSLPMPGHVERCAILAHGRYSYEKGPSAPPLDNLEVVDCRIRNCYGRAVAFYSVVNSNVKDCVIEDIADEGIDLDHFCLHCHVTGNQVKRCVIGICLNDASYCTVRNNHVEDIERTGIVIWWWYKCPMEGLDVENVIADNVVLSPGQAGISLGKRCFRNKVMGNRVQGGIKVVEEDNEIGENTLE